MDRWLRVGSIVFRNHRNETEWRPWRFMAAKKSRNSHVYLPETAPVVGDEDYKKLKRKLNNHLLPKKNKHRPKYTFNKGKQIAGESVVTYAARMHEKSKDCGKRDHKNREKKKMAKALVTVERQEHTLQPETAQHTDNSVWSQVASTTIMCHVAESVPNPKRDLKRPRESESRKQENKTQMMITSTFRRQQNTCIEWRR